MISLRASAARVVAAAAAAATWPLRRAGSLRSSRYLTGTRSHPHGGKGGAAAAAATSVVVTEQRGVDVIHDPWLNKGTAFSNAERERMGTRGLVPPCVQQMEHQSTRVMARIDLCEGPLAKYDFLTALMDRNETLFYRVLLDNFQKLSSIIYTPTVGLACQKSHAIYRRARGMYFSADDRGEMHAMVHNWPRDKVQVIVVTDGSRILGLGDLGANGLNICIGKLALYVAGAGISPEGCLPIMLDVGTNNESLRNDPLYLGLPRPRLEGAEYFSVVDEFMSAVRSRWPNVLVQFEDFRNPYATKLLEKYRHRGVCFNDDIQSTGCVTLAGILASLKVRSRDAAKIVEEKIICVGAGSAGVGVCDSIVHCMIAEGLTEEQARARFYMVDADGLLGAGRSIGNAAAGGAAAFQRPDMEDGLPLEEVVSRVGPTVLLGLSGAGGTFTEGAIRGMSAQVERPVVFALSNPSDNSECTAEQAAQWSDGRAIFASGSPFEDVSLSSQGGKGSIGRRSVFGVSQVNNVYSFPGLGLAVTSCRIRAVTEEMLQASARRLSELASLEQLGQGKLFPALSELRTVSLEVAVTVAQTAFEQGLVGRPPPAKTPLRDFLRGKMWRPDYPVLATPAK